MITRNEKAKGLWWRLLATLPVLAILLIANTKVTAQEKKAKLPEHADSFQIVMYEYEGQEKLPLNDTVIYNEDGSYSQVKREKENDPETNKPRTKVSISSYDKDGNPAAGFHIQTMPREDDIKEFRITANEGFTYPAQPTNAHSNDSTFQVVKDELYRSLLDQAVNDSVFQIVSEMPEFPGGEQKLLEYIAENAKYPQEARDKGISGRVFVGFIVEKDGSISNVKLLRSIGEGCDEEAIRLISSLPKWKPGKQKGEPVRVSYQIPINFKLNDDTPTKSVKKTEANKPEMKPNANGVYQIVEEMPQFPGGETKLMEYIAKNLTYPQEARDKGIDGRVFIGMVIEKDGSVSNVKVLRGIGSGCDEEAVRVINSMPKWKPGKVGGEPVPVSYQIPINFKLAEKQPKKK